MISGLGRQITIQRATVTKSAVFEDVKTWTDLLTTGCELKQIVRQRGQQELVQDDRYATVDDVVEATIILWSSIQ